MNPQPNRDRLSAVNPIDTVATLARSQSLRLALLMAGLNILIPAGLLVYAKFTGQPYWRMFRGEHHLVDWFSSVQLLLIAWVVFLNYSVTGLARRFVPSAAAGRGWVWAGFALSFLLFALDERFDIHEALRDGLFRPLGLFTGTSWLIDGDVGLYLFFAVGLVFSYYLLDDLRRHPPALLLYLLALLLTLPTIVIDSLRDSVLRGWPWWRFWDYAFEEVGEIWAQLLFLYAFLLILSDRLARLKNSVHVPMQDARPHDARPHEQNDAAPSFRHGLPESRAQGRIEILDAQDN